MHTFLAIVGLLFFSLILILMLRQSHLRHLSTGKRVIPDDGAPVRRRAR